MIRLKVLYLFVFSFLIGALALQAEKTESSAIRDLQDGKRFIETKVYTEEEDKIILELFEGLRVADVSDGMDAFGLQNVGLMDPEIHPLWKDTKNFTHRIVGIAVTVRYMPANEPLPGKISEDKYNKWVSNWYNKLSSEPFIPLLRKGSVLVIDDAETDVGSIGSYNIMNWKLHGCVGVVTDATSRDTDEITTEGIPLYFRKVGRGIRPGRNKVESVNLPIECGGVLVRPGDIIVADGDGVICVPREYAKDIADYARKTIEGDKSGRKDLYKKLGLPEDASVK
jgi:4-hydroxy-4-methyl-2-oxoglutarate aldolase